MVGISEKLNIITDYQGNKIFRLTDDITLSEDTLLPKDITLKYSGGSINLNGFELIGDNTKLDVNIDDVIINSITGKISGSWIPPETLSQKNFGAVGDGIQLSDIVISKSDNNVYSESGVFTDSLVGKLISIVGAGRDGVFGQPDNESHTAEIIEVKDSKNLTISIPAINTIESGYARIGTDNFNAILNASYVRNKRAGSLCFVGKDEVFMTTLIEPQPLSRLEPNGWIIGNYTNSIHWVGLGAKIEIFPHDLHKTRMIQFYKTDRSSITGMVINGDYDIYNSENSKGESNSCITSYTLATNCDIRKCRITNFYGDAFNGGGDTQFSNYIQGDNISSSVRDSNIVYGFIDSDGLVDDSKKSHIYSDIMLPISGGLYDNIKELGLNPWYQVTGGSFAGWGGTASRFFYAIYYDKDGNFLKKSEKIDIYERTYIVNPKWEFIRILLEAPEAPENIDLRVRPDLGAFGGRISENWFEGCGRQAISNAPSDILIDNNDFINIGGLKSGPGYGIDIEDRRGLARNVVISNNRFQNNFGDIKLVGTTNAKIYGNMLLRNSIDVGEKGAPTKNIHVGISSEFGRNVSTFGNMVSGKSVDLDRQDHFYGNRMDNGIIRYTANSNIIENNILKDVYFKGQADTVADRYGYPTKIRHNEITYSENTNESMINDAKLKGDFKNNEFTFNSYSSYTYSIDEDTDYLQKFSGNGIKMMFNSSNSERTYGGGLSGGNVIKGILPEISSRDYNTSFDIRVDAINGNDEIHHPISVRKGIIKDYDFPLNIPNGWVSFKLDNFSKDVSESAQTITVTPKIKVSTDYPWSNTGSFLLTTPNKYVNFVFKNGSFELYKESTSTGASNKYIKLGHKGTTLFENIKFYSVSDKVWDLNNTFQFPSELGNVTFIDCEFIGVKVITRPQDNILYTKYTPQLPVWGDNISAVNGGYPIGYMYMSNDGILRVTHK